MIIPTDLAGAARQAEQRLTIELLSPIIATMTQQILAVCLLILGVASGVVGNWLRRPANIRNSTVLFILAGLLVASGVIVFFNPSATGHTEGLAPTTAPGGRLDEPTTPGIFDESSPQPAAITPSSTRVPRGGGIASPSVRPATRSLAPITPSSPYVAGSRFKRYGASQGSFSLNASGSRLDIGVPGTDFHKQWGGILTDHVICSKGSIEFDMELAAGSADYYGFAIIPEGSVLNDRANGTGIGYYHESEADDFIATLATLPQQPLGGLGGGSYPVADLKTARHVVVSVNGSTITTTVDGTPAGDFADIEPTCGSPLIAVWGGATLHLDHVLVR